VLVDPDTGGNAAVSESVAEMILRHEKAGLEMYQRFQDQWLRAAKRSQIQVKMCLSLLVPFIIAAAFQSVWGVILTLFALIHAVEGHYAYKRRMRLAREYTDKISATRLQIYMTENMLETESMYTKKRS